MRTLGLVLAAFSVVALALVAVSTWNAPPGGGGGTPPADEPNVLIVVTDDQPVGMIDAMPTTRDWLRASYGNAVATTPLCCPARAMLLSGRYMHNTGVETLDDAYQFDNRRSMPRALQDAGYVTAMSGKYLNGWDIRNDDPRHFDRFALTNGGYFDTRMRTDAKTGEALGVASPLGRSERQISTIGDAALSWLDDFEADDDRPWMMYLATTAPHAKYRDRSGDAPPMTVTPAMDETDLAGKPPHIRDRTRSHYTSEPRDWMWEQGYETLGSVDAMMADIRARLRARGELENTLVIFTSDNGWLYGQHNQFGKREPYESSLRVPMRMSLPGTIAPGSHDRIVGLHDIAPTVYDAAGIDPGYEPDGQSVLRQATRERILIEHTGGGSYDSNVGDWVGWWSPDAMYRRSTYGDRGTAGCDDENARTLCQRYADAAGGEELYQGRWQTQNLLQRGQRPTAHRRWTADAVQCDGSECAAIEARPKPVADATRWIRPSMDAPPQFREDGESRPVAVTVTNTSGRRLRDVRVDLEKNPDWQARPLTGNTWESLPPGASVTARWSVRFTAHGPVSLSASIRFAHGDRTRQGWTAAPTEVRPGGG